jgi:tetratricopeptide (TPR) repeat protein
MSVAAQVFLSLSYVDADFVRNVKSRLPIGLAHFYEDTFENGESLLKAMEKRVDASRVFVLFASKAGLDSRAVQFEIDQARLTNVFSHDVRILIFPTSPDVTFADLPKWMQSHWMTHAGYTAADIARYITTVLLEPNTGILSGATKVVGRGKTLDRLEQIAADHLQRTKRMPRVYVFAGFSGIGRRTFASYYIRSALPSEPNLAYGPAISLSSQADPMDIYRAVRTAIDSDISPDKLSDDQRAFSRLDEKGQATEVVRILGHFGQLGQAVTLISASGFFEDSGQPKSWIADLLSASDDGPILFLVSNRQFPVEYVEKLGNTVQIRIEELNDKDIRTLMIHTAERLKVPDFDAPDEIVRAIGGHPDVANSAVRIAAQRGVDALKRQPAYLYNVQRTILGETIAEDALSQAERAILDALCWVPALGGDILQEIVRKSTGISEDNFIETCQNLVLSCLIISQGYTYAISSAIRQLYRRWNVTKPEMLSIIASVLSTHWTQANQKGGFREDLFEAFVFMHAFQGEDLPEQLKGLLSPGTLENVIKETYARGKSDDDAEALDRVVAWGALADKMDMSASVREEIMNAVVRSQIRTGKYSDAQETIDRMREAGFSSVAFLQGHFYRRKRDYKKAIEYLEAALDERKYNRSAVHELALAYHRDNQNDRLTALLSKYGKMLNDSAMFLDLSIGIKLRKGDNLASISADIRRLRSLPDDDGRADLREAQLMMRQGAHKEAKNFLTRLLEIGSAGRFHVRTMRAKAAIDDRDFSLARRDIDYIHSLPGREAVGQSLLAHLFLAQANIPEAEAALRKNLPWSADEWKQYGGILEAKAAATHSLSEKMALQLEIDEIHARYGRDAEAY